MSAAQTKHWRTTDRQRNMQRLVLLLPCKCLHAAGSVRLRRLSCKGIAYTDPAATLATFTQRRTCLIDEVCRDSAHIVSAVVLCHVCTSARRELQDVQGGQLGGVGDVQQAHLNHAHTASMQFMRVRGPVPLRQAGLCQAGACRTARALDCSMAQGPNRQHRTQQDSGHSVL